MDKKLTKNGDVHGEAFCIMRYKCKDCGAIELLWNSRDGVTPFGIICRECGKSMLHVDWNLDLYAPKHLPERGYRVFMDMPREIAVIIEKVKIRQLWDAGEYPMKERWGTQEEALGALMEDWEEGEPFVYLIP